MARFDFIATYIVTNRRMGTIYTGSTADLISRMQQHKSGHGSVFTGKHVCKLLVWYERFDEMAAAIHLERRIKTWKRQWKIDLIENINPHWDDLSFDLSTV